MVVHSAVNREVVGSSPTSAAKFKFLYSMRYTIYNYERYTQKMETIFT